MVQGATKTKAGHRTVTLPRGAITELEHRTAYSSTGLIFASEAGAQVRVNKPAAAAVGRGRPPSGTEGLTFHDMGHTAVSLWVAAGASDLEVGKWAGHRSAAFTKSRYARFAEHGQALADRLDAFIACSIATPAGAVVPIRPF